MIYQMVLGLIDMPLRPLTDKEILDVLVAIDLSQEIAITTREAEFLDSAVYNRHSGWTVEQRARAAQIAERYRHQL